VVGPGFTDTSPARIKRKAVVKLSFVGGIGNSFLLVHMWRTGRVFRVGSNDDWITTAGFGEKAGVE
jgi:hypothetical protein